MPAYYALNYTGIFDRGLLTYTSISFHEFSREPVVKEINNMAKIKATDELPQSIIDHIKSFVLFVGHAHSGHSIVGSVTDSHPHIAISDEYDLLTELSS